MLTTSLFVGYAFGVGAIINNMTKVKLQDDFEREVRELREYDFNYETIDPEKDLPNKCMILANYNPQLNKDLIENA